MTKSKGNRLWFSAVLMVALLANGACPPNGQLPPLTSTFWHNVQTGQSGNYEALWGFGTNNVLAVGPTDRMLKWDGTAWSTSTVATGAPNSLFAIWGPSSSDVWAGGDLLGAVLHWNGSSWSSVATPKLTPVVSYDQFAVLGIWGFSSTDVWAVGEFGKVMHLQGSSWRAIDLGAPLSRESFFDVWGASPSDVWAVGTKGTIIHWNGTSWASVPTGAPQDATLSTVWGAAANNVWAAGGSVMVHWDGSSWTRVQLPTGSMSFIEDMWGTSANDVWAVGTGIIHWNGSEWKVVISPARRLFSVWGASPTDLWAVGGGSVVRYSQVNLASP